MSVTPPTLLSKLQGAPRWQLTLAGRAIARRWAQICLDPLLVLHAGLDDVERLRDHERRDAAHDGGDGVLAPRR